MISNKSDVDPARDATATIQGYMFQFDSTILSLCSLSEDAVVDIECIEDFDITSSGLTELFQCKYYEATRLTSSTIRDGILPMLKGFLKLPVHDRPRRRFHLYGYFKDSTPGDSILTPEELKAVLIRREALTDGIDKKYVKFNIQKELDATDADIEAFADQLSIHVTSKAEDHRRRTIEALTKTCSVSFPEAELYVYPTARTLISTIACFADQSKRRLSRGEFILQVSPSKALFNHWSLRQQGETAYCECMRRAYFSHRNIDPIQRVFIFDSLLNGDDADILSLCHVLRRKWSSHGVRRKPDTERFVPIIYFRDLPESRLVTLKNFLHNDDARFVDGYPFLGAAFTTHHLLSPQTYSNKLSLRIISARDELSKVLVAIRGERIVYDFYSTIPTDSLPDCKWVSLPVTSIRSIENII
jgi:hypothetical protein